MVWSLQQMGWVGKDGRRVGCRGSLWPVTPAMSRKPQHQLTDLHTHANPFVTVRQLSDYWKVSRKHVLKLIESGRLESVRLGPRTHRVPVHSAVAFERNSRNVGKLPHES
jgi:excisionase family DNA binding protein